MTPEQQAASHFLGWLIICAGGLYVLVAVFTYLFQRFFNRKADRFNDLVDNGRLTKNEQAEVTRAQAKMERLKEERRRRWAA